MDYLPKISVVLPVRNEASCIQKTLLSVTKSNYPKDAIEILVVDGMSGDKTREVVKDISLRYDNIKLLANPKKIAPTALNTGINHAAGEIIMRLDGHARIAPDYIPLSVNAILNGEADCAGGPWTTRGNGKLIPDAVALAMSSYFGVGGVPFRCLKKRVLVKGGVPFFLMRKETLQKIGPFNEEFIRGQDDEFFHRFDKMGFKTLLLPEAECCYFSRDSLKKLWSQYFQYGFWKTRLFLKYPDSLKMRHFIFFISMITLWSLGIAALFLDEIRLFFLAALFFYIVAVLFFSMEISFKKGLKYFTVLPSVFLILHFAYFLGCVFGLIRWTGQKT